MAKAGKKRKQTGQSSQVLKKFKKDVSLPEPACEAVVAQAEIGNLIFADELETTSETLGILSKNPELISLKALKVFRTAVHDYWRVANEASHTGASLTSRISSALVDQRHVDALVLLSEMEIRGQLPKLGALQRWVRECDAVLVPSMTQADESRVWQVLNAILRTTQPTCVHSIAESALAVLKPLHTTLGPDRRPPNKHPAVRFDVPGLPGAFIIHDVLEASECRALVDAAEAVGMLPDEPTAGSAAQLASVLAHNFIWLADSEFIATLYSRVVDLLHRRLYRYRPGALYRPHIDGAWPASALDETTTPPSYVYDSDPAVYSRLTFLIYLNDDFADGCTTFFLPAAEHGVLDAVPVKPRTGTVCVFPHGAARGSLLHEGSGVTEGTKYVIRTECCMRWTRRSA
ncbi:hypothetical protein B0H10DRAFT_2164277 [Mycena sp. CBHHK59/15]|nr:hypothetical protein B0H10DRAFT_2164277 [Mycena sp. CBHHK59/15]